MSSTEFRKKAGLLLTYRTRSSDHFTSADVSGFPLAKRTLRRSRNVYVLPSGDTVQSVASEGLGVVRSSPSNVTSESYTEWLTMLLVVSTVRAGSRLLTTKLAPTTSAWAPASATGTSVATAATRAMKASRTTTLATREALILDLLRRRPSPRHGTRPEAGRIVARRAAVPRSAGICRRASREGFHVGPRSYCAGRPSVRG